MNSEQVWREFTALPPRAQEQVADFIAFLHTRIDSATSVPPVVSTNLVDEPFIGMWQDRDDMNDSTAWVRQLRTEERSSMA